MAKMTMNAFEKSKFDKKESGKEGSPAEEKKDKAELAKLNKSKPVGFKKAKPGKPVKRA